MDQAPIHHALRAELADLERRVTPTRNLIESRRLAEFNSMTSKGLSATMLLNLRRATLILFILAPLPALADEYQLTEQTTVLRHRSENVQSIPESVTVLTSRNLNETWRGNLEDLEAFVPGLLVDSLAGAPEGAATYMRGIGSNSTSYGMFAPVAITVDGVYIGSAAAQNPSLFDVDHIEVDRGPQGVWSAAPAPAGSINLFTSAPTGKLSAKSRITMGGFQKRRFNTVVNFPIVTNVIGKVAFNWRRGGKAFVRNAYTGRNEDEDQLTAGTLTLVYHNKLADFRYTYDGGTDKADVPALLNLSSSADLVCANSTASANCSVGANGRVPETGSYSYTTQGFSNRRNFKWKQHALHVDFDAFGLHVQSITATRKTDDASSQDMDGTFVDFYSSTYGRHYRQVSEEINATGQHGNRLSYAFGVYALNTDYDLKRTDFYVLKQISDIGDIFAVPTNETRLIQFRQQSQLRSIYGHVSYVLNQWWTADAGLRDNHYTSRLWDGVSRPNPASHYFVVPSYLLHGAYERRHLTGTLGLAYSIADNARSYLRFNRAFRPGGFDENANSPAAAYPFESQSVSGWELGLKSEWFDNHLRLNYAMYREDYKDKLERYTTVTSTGEVDSVLRNTSNLRTFGHEIEITAVPMDNLLLRATLSHNNADYIDYRIPDFTGASAEIDKGGLIPPMSPPDQFAFSALYSFPYREGKVTVYGGYRFTTTYWSDPQITAGHINTFAVMDFSIDYDWQDWKFRFFSQNFNGRRYLTNATEVTAAQLATLVAGTTVDQPLTTTTQYNQPRFSGIEVTYNFAAKK